MTRRPRGGGRVAIIGKSESWVGLLAALLPPFFLLLDRPENVRLIVCLCSFRPARS